MAWWFRASMPLTLPVFQQPQQPPFVKRRSGGCRSELVSSAGGEPGTPCARAAAWPGAEVTASCFSAGAAAHTHSLGKQQFTPSRSTLLRRLTLGWEYSSGGVRPFPSGAACKVFCVGPSPPADARQAIFQCLKGPRGGSRVSAGRAVVWEKPALILWSELVALWSEPVASDTWSPVVLP